MQAKHFFDLERRHLEAASLDDVDRSASEQTIAAILPDSRVTRPEPAVPERGLRLGRPPPVFEEYQRAANLEEFKQIIRDIRARKEREREFERNQRTAPPPEEPVTP